jgi:phospho-N-acetylmuramoyl-pentapeptide-transferase
MIYYFSDFLASFFSPFRLLKSHVFLLAMGTLFAALISAFVLPRFWHLLPRDRGKEICRDTGGNLSAGKPTGAGIIVSAVIFPIIAFFAPLRFWDLMCVVAFYGAMLSGFLDDKATNPWGRRKKFVFDALISVMIASFIYFGHSDFSEQYGRTMLVWMPFLKGVWHLPFIVYVPIAAMIIVVTLNATNCSDGVDGLAGTLTLISMVILAVLLYVVVGYRPAAHYLLIPCYAEAARWAIVVMVITGGFAGYLWFNAEPSKVLMGDAGSRFLGVAIATASLMTGNLFMVVALAPVVLINGGCGLLKILCLRAAKMLNYQIKETAFIHKVRFPFHDHCKKKWGWSNAQVLMRFVLLQLLFMPLLLIILIKVR